MVIRLPDRTFRYRTTLERTKHPLTKLFNSDRYRYGAGLIASVTSKSTPIVRQSVAVRFFIEMSVADFGLLIKRCV